MPNDVTAIILDANGATLFRREDGTYYNVLNGEIPVVEAEEPEAENDDIPFAEMLNEIELTSAWGDTDEIVETYDGEPVYAVNPREEAGAGFYDEDSLSEEIELLCSFVGIRADADCLGQPDRNHRRRDECCVIAQTGELVCYMDGKLTAWSNDGYRIDYDTMQMHGGRHNNAVLGEAVCAVHIFVKPDASYPYRSAGCENNTAIAEAFDEVYA